MTPEQAPRTASALQPQPKSMVRELGLAGLQLWQSLSEATGRERGDVESAILFTDLVESSSELKAGDAAAAELLRDVDAVIETAIIAHKGRIVKRLGDGLMATFPTATAAVNAALEAQDSLQHVELDGYQPRMRAGSTGEDRGGSAQTTSASTSTSPLASAKPRKWVKSWSPTRMLGRLDLLGIHTGKHKRLRAHGARAICAPRQFPTLSADGFGPARRGVLALEHLARLARST